MKSIEQRWETCKEASYSKMPSEALPHLRSAFMAGAASALHLTSKMGIPIEQLQFEIMTLVNNKPKIQERG